MRARAQWRRSTEHMCSLLTKRLGGGSADAVPRTPRPRQRPRPQWTDMFSIRGASGRFETSRTHPCTPPPRQRRRPHQTRSVSASLMTHTSSRTADLHLPPRQRRRHDGTRSMTASLTLQATQANPLHLRPRQRPASHQSPRSFVTHGATGGHGSRVGADGNPHRVKQAARPQAPGGCFFLRNAQVGCRRSRHRK